MNKVKVLCKKCKTNNIKRDAWASWDEDKQEWILDEVFAYAWCEKCEGEASIIEKEHES